MAEAEARERFLELLAQAVGGGTLAKLTLGRYRGAEPSLRNLHVRPVTLKAGPHLCFVWRHHDRDLTRNHPPAEALKLIAGLVGADFLDAHLFAAGGNAQLECRPGGKDHLKLTQPAAPAAASSGSSGLIEID